MHQQVTSKGGTTAAGLAIMEKDNQVQCYKPLTNALKNYPMLNAQLAKPKP